MNSQIRDIGSIRKKGRDESFRVKSNAGENWKFMFPPGFHAQSVPSSSASAHASGFLCGSVLPDGRLTYSTMTSWDNEDSLQSYVQAKAHASTTEKFVQWCDEASVVRWVKRDRRLPSSPIAVARMRKDGRPLKLRHPTPDHLTMTLAPLRVTGAASIEPLNSPAAADPVLTRRRTLAWIGVAVSEPHTFVRGPPLIRSFEIPYSREADADLRHRLQNTRWSDAVTHDWSYGTEINFLQRLVRVWAESYDWSQRCDQLNALPHFRMSVDDYGLNFLHHRSEDRTAIPLLLMNGWPSSFVEFGKLVPKLVVGTPAFHVVIPSHPGFGFTERPTRPYQVEPSDVYPRLMTALGYDRFLVAGTDIGAGVATRIALRHPDRVIAVHVSAIASKPRAATDRPQTKAELAFSRAAAEWDLVEGGYQTLQSSRPQTLAFALADSPAGLASWIIEKFRAWSDCAGDLLSVWPSETLLDNLMIYWISGTIGASMRYYYEGRHLRPALQAGDYVSTPTAVAIWPHDLAHPPRELAERLYNVRSYTRFERGGHFPAWEAPQAYAQDIRRLASATGVR